MIGVGIVFYIGIVIGNAEYDVEDLKKL